MKWKIITGLLTSGVGSTVTAIYSSRLVFALYPILLVIGLCSWAYYEEKSKPSFARGK